MTTTPLQPLLRRAAFIVAVIFAFGALVPAPGFAQVQNGEEKEKIKNPKKLPKETNMLDGRVIIAIDPETRVITPYLEGKPTKIELPGNVAIKSIVPLPGSEYVILTYEASPKKTVLCRWVGSTYTCYEV